MTARDYGWSAVAGADLPPVARDTANMVAAAVVSSADRLATVSFKGPEGNIDELVAVFLTSHGLLVATYVDCRSGDVRMSEARELVHEE